MRWLLNAGCSKQVVGVALVRPAVDVSELQSQYQLEDFILMTEHKPAGHVELLTFVINPIFARSSRHVLREALRQLGASCVYYRLHPAAPIPDVLLEFVQVKPRAQITVPDRLKAELVADGSLVDASAPLCPSATSSLFFLTRKLISEPKIVNNTRIVVVGASDTALALLESLLSVPRRARTATPRAARLLMLSVACSRLAMAAPADGRLLEPATALRRWRTSF